VCVLLWPLLCAQAADRLLLVTEALTGSGPGSSFAAAGSMAGHDPSDSAAGSGSDLHVHHVPLPAAYLAANWPVQHVAVSACGADIAAAGRQGLALFNRRQEKWRLFGDVSQVGSGRLLLSQQQAAHQQWQWQQDTLEHTVMHMPSKQRPDCHSTRCLVCHDSL
jgi:hypothetical protein